MCLAAPFAAAQPAQTSASKGFELGESPFSVMMRWRPTKEPREMPDFVRKSRPPEESLQYQPLVGVEPAGPARKTPEEVAAAKAKLDAAGRANRARAGR
jgi:hypothetical protein